MQTSFSDGVNANQKSASRFRHWGHSGFYVCDTALVGFVPAFWLDAGGFIFRWQSFSISVTRCDVLVSHRGAKGDNRAVLGNMDVRALECVLGEGLGQRSVVREAAIFWYFHGSQTVHIWRDPKTANTCHGAQSKKGWKTNSSSVHWTVSYSEKWCTWDLGTCRQHLLPTPV